MKKSGSQPSLRAQWLGERMQELRKSHRIPQYEASRHIRRDPSMLGRYENGEIPFRRDDVESLLDYYGASTDLERTGLLQLCDDIWKKGWWDPHRDDLGETFINVPWLESRVDQMRTYEHFVVAGLLQTREYAETLIRANAPARTPEDQIARWVDLRMKRIEVLAKDDAPKLAVFLDETVLDRPVGTTSAMRCQLEYLLEARDRPNIELRITPTAAGPHAAQAGSFILFEMPHPYPDVAHATSIGGSIYIEEPRVSEIRHVWTELDECTLEVSESTDLIKHYLEKYQ